MTKKAETKNDKNYKEKLYTELEDLKFLLFGFIGEKDTDFGAIDLTFIGIFLLVSATMIILLNLPYWLIIPAFFVFSLIRTRWDIILTA